MLDALANVLEPSWHEARMAGRVSRHTEILRAVAHEISNDPEREDLPKSAAEAKAHFEAFLADLAAGTPRTGLAAPTGAFIDDLIARAKRYADHLFICFDDSRIPATTNGLEGYFGAVKSTLRRALGTGSTTNTAPANLGGDLLVAYHFVRRPTVLASVRVPDATPAQFSATRDRLKQNEASGVHRRSIVRNFKKHLHRLRDAWRSDSGP